MNKFILWLSFIIHVTVSPISQQSVKDLSLQLSLPDKIPDFAYNWTR